MRYGFFHGVDGDVAALEAALQVLGDCDRIFCLGGLLGQKGPVEVEVLEALESIEVLSGAAERRRASDRGLPEAVRERLRGLREGAVVDGIAVVPLPRRKAPARERQALGGAPRLVAPVAVMASAEGARLWRAAGGLARVQTLEGACQLPVGPERIRLDLGPVRSPEGGLQVAVIDTAAGTLELRTGTRQEKASPVAVPVPASPAVVRRPSRRRRRVGEERQLLLAV